MAVARRSPAPRPRLPGAPRRQRPPAAGNLRARAWPMAVLGGVLGDEVGMAYLALLAAIDERRADEVALQRARLFRLLAAEAELYPEPLVGDAWQNHLLDRLLADDNPFSLKAQRAALDGMGSALVGQAYVELAALQGLHALDTRRLQAAALRLAPDDRWLAWDGFRPLGADAAPRDPAAYALKRRLSAATDWGALLSALAEHY